jgi:Fe2+ or Zn2+ uptake regulation protein
VYKTLHEFASIGLIRELGLPGAMRFDANAGAHAHLVCDDCGTVVDIPITPALDDALSDTARDLRVSGVEITLRGSCASCSKR